MRKNYQKMALETEISEICLPDHVGLTSLGNAQAVACYAP